MTPVQLPEVPALRDRVLTVLNAYRQNMEGYCYFSPNYGVSEDDFEDIAEQIVSMITPSEANSER